VSAEVDGQLLESAVEGVDDLLIVCEQVVAGLLQNALFYES